MCLSWGSPKSILSSFMYISIYRRDRTAVTYPVETLMQRSSFLRETITGRLGLFFLFYLYKYRAGPTLSPWPRSCCRNYYCRAPIHFFLSLSFLSPLLLCHIMVVITQDGGSHHSQRVPQRCSRYINLLLLRLQLFFFFSSCCVAAGRSQDLCVSPLAGPRKIVLEN